MNSQTSNERIKKQKTQKRKDLKKEKNKNKKPRPLKHEIGIEEPIETLDILKALAETRFEQNGKVIVGGTKEHATFLKQYLITGLNHIFRSIKKDEIAIVLIMKYKHSEGKSTSSVELMSDLLKTCAMTKQFQMYYNEVSQSSIQTILQINYTPRMIAIKKSYLNEPILKSIFTSQ